MTREPRIIELARLRMVRLYHPEELKAPRKSLRTAKRGMMLKCGLSISQIGTERS